MTTNRRNYADGGAIFAQFPRPRPLTVKEAVRLPDQALRGLIAGTAGLPGDLEGLGRMLINLTGDRVNPESALPTTEFYQEYLPGRAKGDTADIISGASALFGGAGSTKAARALNNGVNRAAGALSRMPARAYANGGPVGYTNFGYSNPFASFATPAAVSQPPRAAPPVAPRVSAPSGALTQLPQPVRTMPEGYRYDYAGNGMTDDMNNATQNGYTLQQTIDNMSNYGNPWGPGGNPRRPSSNYGGEGGQDGGVNANGTVGSLDGVNIGGLMGAVGALSGNPGISAIGGAMNASNQASSGNTIGALSGAASVLGGLMGVPGIGQVASAVNIGNAIGKGDTAATVNGVLGIAAPATGMVNAALGLFGAPTIGQVVSNALNMAMPNNPIGPQQAANAAAAAADDAQAAAADASSASLGGVSGGSNSSADASSADATNGADAQSDAASAADFGGASDGGASAGVGVGASSGWGGGGAGSGVGADGYGGSSSDAGGADAGGDGCYITTATEHANGKTDDNAYELQTLRRFREEFMMKDPGLAELVSRYEMMAPSVVAGIKARPDASELFKGLHKQFIAPASRAVSRGDNAKALNIYADMLAHVAPLAEPMLQDPTPAIELGQQAAQVAELTE